jgi:hypothetical protein
MCVSASESGRQGTFVVAVRGMLIVEGAVDYWVVEGIPSFSARPGGPYD